ncbi:bifunctional DNA primase/polymerase [Chryseobacterium sp.]|uniref:bifunctional DNA primase/polymerase n=1 Tax=Chryseobacterium sp. TaxID=1871047 RepID=UPI0011C93D86|nr:bifunctional DNA primase/polymerase [Chryseobacterium sp.]TXF75929.1 hypothetical protein FUA25_08470 [Chryseobacterium sp.]
MEDSIKFGLELLQHHSVIPLRDNKMPAIKEVIPYRTSKMDPLMLAAYIQNNCALGVITGFGDLECIDVDTKVFFKDEQQQYKTVKQQKTECKNFENEYFQTLRDHIEDFDKKIALYKTMSGGFHLLYRAKNVGSGKKLAKLKGYKGAVIETRGTGNYIMVYKENQLSVRSYFNITYITNEERDIIIQISQMYDHKEEYISRPKKAISSSKSNGFDIPVWDDYNQRTNIWDIISDDFHIPHGGVKTKYTLIRRNGATSPYSGYIYHNSGNVYLFSTGTRYPAEKLITPFHALSYKKFGGDPRQTAQALFRMGYGKRIINQQKII